MRDIKLVIFDMDGLLFDTERIGFRAFKKGMDRFGFPFTMEVYKKLIGAGKKEDEIILKEIYGSDFDLKPISKVSSKEFDYIIEKEEIRIMPGVHELLDVLDQRKIKKCIASSSSISRIEKFLNMTNLINRFDFYMSGEEVENGKPHPDIFIEACNRADIDKRDALILEDSMNGLRAAKNASIKCILIPDLVEQNEEMQRDAYHITDNLANLVEKIGVLKI